MKPPLTADRLVASERRGIAGLLAVLVHLLFLGLMVFAVSWQTKPQPVVAEVWADLPAPDAAAPPPKPEPAPAEPPPPPPKPAPKPAPPEPKPAPEPPRPKVAEPPPKPVAEPKVKTPPTPEPKADIALEKEKKRKEAERLAEVEARHKRELAEAARRDEESRREAEAAKAAAQAAEQARAREQEAAQAAAAEQQRQRDALTAQQAQAQAQAAQQARARATDLYRAQIMRAVRSRLVEPAGVQGNPQAEVKVLQLPNGEVVSVKVTKPSGNPAYDEAVERAVLAASPLPLPADRGLFNRDVVLQFRLRE